jgi:hypothetical protein
MAGIWRIPCGIVACFTMFASSAAGWGGQTSIWPSYYYYWTPPAYFYCPPGPVVIPVPEARTTKEPPLAASNAGRPTITTTRSFGDETGVPSKERCRVGFWNLTGRDVALTVSGKTWTLLKNQAATLELDRQFSWQVAGQAQHLERVPEGQAAYEVVVRE